jgi:hypothetical protein
MDDIDRDWHVRPVTRPIAFPLHQRQLTLVQRHGRGTAMVVSSVTTVIGLLFVAGWATKGGGAMLAIGLALVGAAALALASSTRFGRFTSASGMVALQPDRPEISDERHLAAPIVLLRHRIVAVCSPGMAHEQPGLRRDLGLTSDIHCLGDARPNVEVWLANPLERPVPVAPPGWPRRPVVALQLLTPGAATMIEWFRSGLTEHHRSLMTDITDAPGLPSES